MRYLHTIIILGFYILFDIFYYMFYCNEGCYIFVLEQFAPKSNCGSGLFSKDQIWAHRIAY